MLGDGAWRYCDEIKKTTKNIMTKT